MIAKEGVAKTTGALAQVKAVVFVCTRAHSVLHFHSHILFALRGKQTTSFESVPINSVKITDRITYGLLNTLLFNTLCDCTKIAQKVTPVAYQSKIVVPRKKHL